jgi:hypothetical protein
MRSRSNSAIPAKIVIINLPACVVVSAQGSEYGLEASASIADSLDDLEQIAGGTGQPVEFPKGDDVALTKVVEHPVQRVFEMFRSR